MDSLNDFLESDTARRVLIIVLFIIALIVAYWIYRFVLNRLRNRARKTVTQIDDFIIDLLRIPVLWLIFWLVLRIFTAYSFISQTDIYGSLSQINNILLIGTIGWILIKAVRIAFYYFENRININEDNNYAARKNLTKMKIFEGIIVALITVVTIAIALMTFEKVRTLGISLLTSAGIAGIIVGFAAQKSIASIFAGIQIALTQPIRLEDQVVVEGQNGRVEEITLTYVVVKLWDEKRLILPVNYFLEQPFQNWTRNSSNVLATVFLYTDYTISIDALRKQLDILLKDHPKWDRRIAVVQVTDAKEDCIETRILLSSYDSGASFDLQVDIREKMIDFINKEYPGCWVKYRVVSDINTKSIS